jgi:hypothetical protein
VITSFYFAITEEWISNANQAENGEEVVTHQAPTKQKTIIPSRKL